ncbi:MAG: hypothetical protein SV760_00340 [Halobacteria archaeon]|nr:hypothetical protein [Halobacteria archaeon]
MFEADSKALEAGVDDGVLERSIREISSTRAEGEEGSRGVESVFYPIPSIEERTRRLGEGSTTGAWNCARVRLFLSWAGLDFLSRSVHCNVGKPGVWVFLPAD